MIKVLFGLILVFIAFLIFFEPLMISDVTAYLPSYIDTTYLPYVVALFFIVAGTILIFSAN